MKEHVGMQYRALLVSFAASVAFTSCSKPPEEQLADRMAMLGKYCTDCHNDAEQAGGMSLEHERHIFLRRPVGGRR